MVKTKYLVIMAVLFLGLIVSGCADNASTEDQKASEDIEDVDTSLAEETLNEEMVGITDTEIQDIEEELAEIETLINETNGTDIESDIVVEEI
ncbi:hypothetical protein [Methanolobus sp. WCC4]|uniref:hypothetical protein n=1 Tax=Methanolobus sp. WCC4 TaxID=3125784 RepID=UPI0030FC4B38